MGAAAPARFHLAGQGAPPEQAQRIDVTFTPAAGGTRVELVHSGWEKLGDAAAARRDSYDKGWVRVFEQCYADYANGGAA